VIDGMGDSEADELLKKLIKLKGSSWIKKRLMDGSDRKFAPG